MAPCDGNFQRCFWIVAFDDSIISKVLNAQKKKMKRTVTLACQHLQTIQSLDTNIKPTLRCCCCCLLYKWKLDISHLLPPPFIIGFFHPQTKSMCSGSRSRSWKQSPLASLLLRKRSHFQPGVKRITSKGKHWISTVPPRGSQLQRGFVCTFLHPIHRSQRSLRWDPLNFVSVGMQTERMAQLSPSHRKSLGGERSRKAS